MSNIDSLLLRTNEYRCVIDINDERLLIFHDEELAK